MSDLNNFFKTLYRSPSMIWKGGAGLLFLCMGVATLVSPSFNIGLEGGAAYAFSGLLVLYGLFRLWGCYAEYKTPRDE